MSTAPVLQLAELTRDSAREAAREELGRAAYADAEPSTLLRLLGRALRELGGLLDGLVGGIGSSWPVQVLLALLLVPAVAAALVRYGLPRWQPVPGSVFGGERPRTAAEHRAAAEALAGEGRLAEAVRERLRAVVRELEERGVLDPGAGRTAGEVAREAGGARPNLAGDLRRAAVVFDEVWYGGRPGSGQAYATVAGVDDRVRGQRPAQR